MKYSEKIIDAVNSLQATSENSFIDPDETRFYQFDSMATGYVFCKNHEELTFKGDFVCTVKQYQQCTESMLLHAGVKNLAKYMLKSEPLTRENSDILCDIHHKTT